MGRFWRDWHELGDRTSPPPRRHPPPKQHGGVGWWLLVAALAWATAEFMWYLASSPSSRGFFR